MPRTKRNYLALRVVDPNGRTRRPRGNAGSKLLTRCPPRRIAVQRQKDISADVLPFPTKTRDENGPCIGGDAATGFPLLDCPSALPEIEGHLSNRVPVGKYVEYSPHASDSVGDGLSRQVGAMNPVTARVLERTICPHMGRGKTPFSTKNAIAERLRAARIAAGFSTQAQFAKALRIEVERYKKWESGRTPIPAEFVAPACELLGQDANYLYGVEPRPRTRARESA